MGHQLRNLTDSTVSVGNGYTAFERRDGRYLLRGMHVSQDLAQLRNIGPTIRKRLNENGICTRADLERIGPVKAYKRIRENYPNQTIPVCYYLYSLQGALMDLHWDELPQAIKEELYAKAKAHQQGVKRGRD